MPGHAAGVQRASTGCLYMDLCVMDAAEAREGVSQPSPPLETIPNIQSHFDQHALLEMAKKKKRGKQGKFHLPGKYQLPEVRAPGKAL